MRGRVVVRGGRSWLRKYRAASSLNRLCALLIAGLLPACSVIPGSHLSMPAMTWFQKGAASEAADIDVNFVAITPGLISEMGAQPRLIEPLSAMQQLQRESELQAYQYRIGRGDTLNITVYEHPELTIPAGSFRSAEEGGNQVGPDGTFYFPYAGMVEALGKTTQEVRNVLVTRLSRVIEQPQVDVKVVGFQSQKVYVSGEVVRPAVVPIKTTPLTLIEAISEVGGLGVLADWRHIQLTRDGIGKQIDLRAILEDGDWRNNVMLRGGDILHIPRNDSQKIYVMGEVRQPSAVLIGRDSVTLTQAIAEAGGIDEAQANARGIFVLRNAEKRVLENGKARYMATVYQLDASSASGFLLANEFHLRPRDVVYITAAPVARWNRLITQLLPSLIFTDQAQGLE